MKASFYLIIWPGVYILLGCLLFDVPHLSNSELLLISSCIIVAIVHRLTKKVFAKTLECQRNNEIVRMLEQVYTNNKEDYYKDKRFEIGKMVVIMTYLILCIIRLIYMSEPEELLSEYLSYGVYALFIIANLPQLIKQIRFYNHAKKNNSFGYEQNKAFNDMYNTFCACYAIEGNADALLMKYPGRSYQIITMITAIFSILIGLFLLLCCLEPHSSYEEPYLSISFLFFTYGSLLFIYGVKDIVEVYRTSKILKSKNNEITKMYEK